MTIKESAANMAERINGLLLRKDVVGVTSGTAIPKDYCALPGGEMAKNLGPGLEKYDFPVFKIGPGTGPNPLSPLMEILQGKNIVATGGDIENPLTRVNIYKFPPEDLWTVTIRQREQSPRVPCGWGIPGEADNREALMDQPAENYRSLIGPDRLKRPNWSLFQLLPTPHWIRTERGMEPITTPLAEMSTVGDGKRWVNDYATVLFIPCAWDETKFFFCMGGNHALGTWIAQDVATLTPVLIDPKGQRIVFEGIDKFLADIYDVTREGNDFFQAIGAVLDYERLNGEGRLERVGAIRTVGVFNLTRLFGENKIA